ncbi:MAG: hypothetical protein U0V73_02470 [Acidimicrobiia bacterium]
MSFYDQVLREIVVAVGAALFLGSTRALVRRRADAERAAADPAFRKQRERAGELVQAPVARTSAFAILGFVMMVAGIGALVRG